MDKKRTRETIAEVYKDSGIGKWMGENEEGTEPGWDRYNTKGDRVGKCGDSKPGEGKPKCLSKEKAEKLRKQGGKKAIANAVRRKREQDPVQDRPGTGNKPKMVSNNIKEATMEKIDIRGIFPDMMISVNGEPCLVESVNRVGDSSYCVKYIKENRERGKEFFLKGDFVDIMEEVEIEPLTEKKEAKKPLNKIFRGGPKKFYVFVRNDKGNVVKVTFGDKNMEIKRDDPERRKNFRARHGCNNPGPKWKARYWACRTWEKGTSVSDLTDSYCPECQEDLQEARKNKPNDPEKWNACIGQAKKKFDVYPSAYANAWASKCYKEKGGTWSKLNEEVVKDVDGKQFFRTKEGKTIVSDIEKQLNSRQVFPGKDQPFKKKLAKLIALGNELHMKEKQPETPEQGEGY